MILGGWVFMSQTTLQHPTSLHLTSNSQKRSTSRMCVIDLVTFHLEEQEGFGTPKFWEGRAEIYTT